MKMRNGQFDKYSGSALILVVVVTVLLAVVGVMFLMVSRAGEMETSAVIESKDLDAAVGSVVSRIDEVLVADLFGNDNQMVDNDPGASDESYDAVSPQDFWLASLEPFLFNNLGDADPSNDIFAWQRISDLYGDNFGIPPAIPLFDPQSQESDISLIDIAERNGSIPELRVDATDTLPKIIRPKDRTYAVDSTIPAQWAKEYAGARADADGDGVADSRWVQMPNLTTGRGEPVFAAVRIIDNCAMLNLNTATCFNVRNYSDPQKTSPFAEAWNYWYENPINTFTSTPWHSNQGSGSGRYLTEINYLPFLRGRDLNGNFFAGTSGGDFWYNLMVAKGLYKLSGGDSYPFAPAISHNIVMNIESAGLGYHFFDLGDELELRNRYLLTSLTESRFERPDVANFSLDSGSTDYAALQVPRDADNPILIWYERIDPVNFDKWDMTGALAVGSIPYKYDRRHVCTFYSFDRMFRKGEYPLLEADLLAIPAANREWVRALLIPKGPVTTNIENPAAASPCNNTQTRQRILHLLFAFREYFYDKNGGDIPKAAGSAVQAVANIIDFSDDNDTNPTSASTAEKQGPFY
ncbi:MAG: hypothetical protein L0Y36_07770, partial [Planctomycetales bacterium]|nr:hypothetical protein [Planctomycetales bacterium]